MQQKMGTEVRDCWVMCNPLPQLNRVAVPVRGTAAILEYTFRKVCIKVVSQMAGHCYKGLYTLTS